MADAAAWVASRTPAQVADYLRSKSPSSLLLTLLTKLAASGLAGSGPIPDGTMLPLDPIAAGQYLHVPVLAGNTRDEGKLFPTFLFLLGGPSGRLVSDKQLFDIQYGYHPDAPAQIAIEQWDPRRLPAGRHAGNRLQRPHRAARRDLPAGGRGQRAGDAEVAAERGLVLPLRLGPGAGSFQRHLRRGPRLRPAAWPCRAR